MQNKRPYKLLAPGPVPLPKQVLDALSRPALHHRTPHFTKLLEFCFSGLQKVYETNEPVLIQTSTGSGVMESAVVNTLSPGDEVLCVTAGKFGERWAEICRAYGMQTHEFQVEWGKALPLDDFEAHLKRLPQVKAVFTQACETSTGTVFPIQKMARLTHSHTEALMIVDAITAMACMNLPMDKWGLDVVVAGSQKAFMLPTGLGFIGLSQRAQEASKKSLCPKFYWDWKTELKAYPKTTHFSSPNSLIVALTEVLKIFQTSGLDTVKQRCEALSQATRAGVEALGLKVFSESPSSSLTAFTLPDGVEGGKLRQWLEDERNITVMGGQEKLKGRILRIGHMGAITNEDLHSFFKALAEGLKLSLPSNFDSVLDRHLSSSKEYFL